MAIFNSGKNDWEDGYNEYQQRALFYTVFDYLRHGDRFRFKDGRRILQVLITPSFQPTISYELFVASTQNKLHLLQTIWQTGSDDAPAFRQRPKDDVSQTYQPNFQYHHEPISKSLVDPIFRDMQKKIPVWFSPNIEDHYVGRDGTTYEFAIGGHLTGVRYQWWSEKPDTWNPLYEIADKAVATFEDILSKSS